MFMTMFDRFLVTFVILVVSISMFFTMFFVTCLTLLFVFCVIDRFIMCVTLLRTKMQFEKSFEKYTGK